MLSTALPTQSRVQSHHVGRVRQHDYITFATQRRIGVMAKRILARVLDQIGPEDVVFRPCYQVSVSSLIEFTGTQLRNAYPEVEEAVRELANITWHIKCPKGVRVPRHLLDTTQAQAVGYARGVVTLILNPQMAEYFLSLVDYTTYELTDYLRLNTWYAMRLYELLSSHRGAGVWEVSVDEYRRLMDCELPYRGQVAKHACGLGKYPRIHDLVLNTVTKPLIELVATDMRFDYSLLYAEKQGKGRRRVGGLRFEAKVPVGTEESLVQCIAAPKRTVRNYSGRVRIRFDFRD
jgi:hypothetical protein